MKTVFTVKSLSGLLADWEACTGVQSDTAVITVDDGYADNFQPLMEAAQKLGVPSTVYVTTNCIDRRQPTDTMWVMLLIHFARVDSIKLPELGPITLRLRTTKEKEIAIREIERLLRPLSADKRADVIQRLIEKSGRADFVRQLGRSAMLEWEQIRLMHWAGIEIGAHSLNHPVLSRLDPAVAHNEIVESIQRVKAMLGVETVTFAYPYGGHAEVNAEVIEICRRSGAAAGVMLVEGDIRGGDVFKIPRMLVTSAHSTSPWGQFSRAVWACELEGIVNLGRGIGNSLYSLLCVIIRKSRVISVFVSGLYDCS